MSTPITIFFSKTPPAPVFYNARPVYTSPMQVKLKVPHNATMAHAVGEVGKRLRAEVRKLRRKTWPDMPDKARPWPKCYLVSVTSKEVTYEVTVDTPC